MEIAKNILFNILVIIGLMTICLSLIWYILELLNRIFKFTKCIIMYLEYKRNIELYNFKDKLIVSKDGNVPYSCIDDLDKQVEILEKAIRNRKDIKQLKDKFSR